MKMALLSLPESGTPTVVVSPSSSSTFRCSSSFVGLLSVFLFLLLLILLGHYSSPSSALYLAYRHNRNKSNQLHQRPLTLGFNETQCNIFMGSWVYDDTYPMYESSQCPFIDPQFNCQLNGRPDSSYLKYSWMPATCKLPRFNGEEFLSRMEGKTVMFVGDSLGKNQWESLACMISTALPPNSPTKVSKSVPLSTIKFVEYDVAISYYKAPYLVDIDLVQGKRVLKLDDISGNGNSWRGVDVLVFNSGHWWEHTGSFQGWDYMESGGKYYQDMDRLTAFEHGLRTWAKWIDANIDTSSTKVFFKSISPTHYNPTQLNAGTGTPTRAINSVSPSKNCYGETTPTAGMAYPADGYRTEYGGQMKAIDSVLRDMKYPPPYLLDITMLSAMRKDAHPSVYSSDLKPSQRSNPSAADCSHWCVPGLPDTWNQLLYTALFF